MKLSVERHLWLARRVSELKQRLGADAASTRSSHGADRRENLYLRLAKLSNLLTTAGDDEDAVLRLEVEQVRPLVAEIRAFEHRDHMTLARPRWAPAPATGDPSFVYFSGPEGRRAQIERIANPRKIAVSAGSYSGSDFADARWRDQRAAGIAVFELSGMMPQVFYDLGIAVTLGAELLLFASETTKLPFNIAQDVLRYPPNGPSDAFIERALDDTLYRISTTASDGRGTEAVVTHARSLVNDNNEGLASAVVDEAKQLGQDSLAVFAILQTLGPVLGDAKLSVLRSRWPSPAWVSKATCFVVMPFLDDLYPTFELISERCQTAGIEPIRGDQAGGQEIIARIWRELVLADGVVVDLTGFNPNVCMELGIAHTLGRPTLLLGRRGTEDKLFPSIAKLDCHAYDQPGKPTSGIVQVLDEFLRRTHVD